MRCFRAKDKYSAIKQQDSSASTGRFLARDLGFARQLMAHTITEQGLFLRIRFVALLSQILTLSCFEHSQDHHSTMRRLVNMLEFADAMCVSHGVVVTSGTTVKTLSAEQIASIPSGRVSSISNT